MTNLELEDCLDYIYDKQNNCYNITIQQSGLCYYMTITNIGIRIKCSDKVITALKNSTTLEDFITHVLVLKEDMQVLSEDAAKLVGRIMLSICLERG